MEKVELEPMVGWESSFQPIGIAAVRLMQKYKIRHLYFKTIRCSYRRWRTRATFCWRTGKPRRRTTIRRGGCTLIPSSISPYGCITSKEKEWTWTWLCYVLVYTVLIRPSDSTLTDSKPRRKRKADEKRDGEEVALIIYPHHSLKVSLSRRSWWLLCRHFSG